MPSAPQRMETLSQKLYNAILWTYSTLIGLGEWLGENMRLVKLTGIRRSLMYTLLVNYITALAMNATLKNQLCKFKS